MKQSHPIESERQNNNRSDLTVNNASLVSQAFVDNRESTAVQRQLMAKMTRSPQAIAQRKLSEQMNNSPRMLAQRQQIAEMSGNAVQRVEGEEELLQGKFKTVQRVEEDEELLQGKFGVAQRVEEDELLQGQFAPIQRVEEDELLQGKFDTVQRVQEDELLQGKFDTAQLEQAPAEKVNNTGLPDNLKQGIENLSGISMNNVKVHYNSSKPAQLNALAYAQGTDIHLGAGQEKHLPHEAWHVVQQAQGRVKPTMQMKDGVPVNDDQGLESEADLMGAKAVAGVVQARQELGGLVEPDPLDFAVQLNKNKSVALGFTDLKNETYQQDDVLGRRPENDGQLAKFRDVTRSMGPEAMGINQQADPTGAIQPQFTDGIKKAMASAKIIKQNLAGFTPQQVQFAYNHKPALTQPEIDLLKHNHPDYAQTMMGGKIVEKDVTGKDGAEWFAMKDLLLDKDDPGKGPHPQVWEPWKAPISVWELSHHLHSASLFEKTEFEYFDTNYRYIRLIPPQQLTQMGISLNQADLMTDEELGVVPPESAFAKFSKKIKKWF